MENTYFYALRPKTGAEPQPPQIGDKMRDSFGTSTVLDVVPASKMAHVYDDENGTISHFYFVAEDGRDHGAWQPHYANEDAVRLPASDYFAKTNQNRRNH